jgi:DUF917 family protein
MYIGRNGSMITHDNLDAFLEGLAILGTGGGGSPDWGRAILLNDFAKGRTAAVVDPEDVPNGAYVCSGGMMGSVKLLDTMIPDQLVAHWEERFELVDAFRLMEETIGHRIEYILPCELGGLNTPVILSLGARTGRPVIDGDGLGRASPETHMVSLIGYGISLTPMPLVDAAGNQVVVRHGVEATFADELGRWVIARGGGMGANAHYPMTGAQMKEAAVPNTISKALALGQAVLHARSTGEDPVAVAASRLDGLCILTDRIRSIEEQMAEGFYITRVKLAAGAEIVIKNEALALLIDGSPRTIFPDLICMLDPKTGRGLMSAHLKAGDDVAVVVAPCHRRLRGALQGDAARRAFSPARFGLPHLDNQPIQELLPALVGDASLRSGRTTT